MSKEVNEGLKAELIEELAATLSIGNELAEGYVFTVDEEEQVINVEVYATDGTITDFEKYKIELKVVR